jgi:hypothetical protein
MEACSKAHEDIVKMLLAAKADVNVVARVSPGKLTCSSQSLLIDFVVASQDEMTALKAACSGGSVQIVKLIMAKGVAVNVQK